MAWRPRQAQGLFSKHARLFVEAVREQGATPILLMTHAYERVRHVDLDLIARAHQDPGDAWTLGYFGILRSGLSTDM